MAISDFGRDLENRSRSLIVELERELVSMHQWSAFDASAVNIFRDIVFTRQKVLFWRSLTLAVTLKIGPGH